MFKKKYVQNCMSVYYFHNISTVEMRHTRYQFINYFGWFRSKTFNDHFLCSTYLIYLY